jgi:hypothetical protein
MMTWKWWCKHDGLGGAIFSKWDCNVYNFVYKMSIKNLLYIPPGPTFEWDARATKRNSGDWTFYDIFFCRWKMSINFFFRFINNWSCNNAGAQAIIRLYLKKNKLPFVINPIQVVLFRTIWVWVSKWFETFILLFGFYGLWVIQ